MQSTGKIEVCQGCGLSQHNRFSPPLEDGAFSEQLLTFSQANMSSGGAW